MFDKARKALLAWKVWRRLEEEKVKGKLLTALVGLGGAILTAVVAKYTTQCPSLLSNVGAILTSGIGGGWAYYRARTNTTESALLGFGAAGVSAMGAHITMLCGSDFWTIAPTITTAGVCVGVLAWLRPPMSPA
jgi:hypothetical protein